jgi:dihydromethanopterin reductase (acceptor)
MKVLWCITGGGYMLEESCKALEQLDDCCEVTVAFSKAGREVTDMYGLSDRIKKCAAKIIYEEDQGSSSPIVCKVGRYDKVVVSPCTANTTAKIVLGIADSLVTNIVSQALKSGRKVIIVPTDIDRDVSTMIPSGKKILIKCRRVDIDNAMHLKKIDGMKVVSNPDEVKKFIQNVD